ncbi:hypothetical protein LINPERPRIM_LOCUS33502 [Linum perenne]
MSFTKIAGGKASSWRSSSPGNSLSSSEAPRSRSCLGGGVENGKYKTEAQASVNKDKKI